MACEGSSGIALNAKWRVVASDDRAPYRQWLLQKRSGDGWSSVSFCQTRHGLMTAIHEKVERGHAFYGRGSENMPVEPTAMEAIRALPDRIPQI